MYKLSQAIFFLAIAALIGNRLLPDTTAITQLWLGTIVICLIFILSIIILSISKCEK